VRLKEVKISGFRSIQNEAVLLVDSNITILIGANDHGKTNILKAIETLNDNVPFTPDDQNWDTEGDIYPHVEWLFELTPEEQQEFSNLAMQVETSNAPTQKTENRNITLLTSKQLTEVRFCRSGVSNAIDIPEKGLSKAQKDFLLKARPRVELFSIPQKGSIDSVTKAQLDDDQYEFMKGLFMKAGLWEISDKIFQLNTRTSKLLDDASQKLTKILQKEWEQGKNLSWKFKHSGNGSVIEIEIIDPSVSKQYVRPSQRSSGFTAFFVTNLALSAFFKVVVAPTAFTMPLPEVATPVVPGSA